MTHPSHDLRYEFWIARILQGGIILSAALMLTGLFLVAVQSGVITLPAENPSLKTLFHSLFGNSESISASTFMYAGIVVLMLTPFLRVAATFVVFLFERDLKYATVAAIVLIMLIGEILVAF